MTPSSGGLLLERQLVREERPSGASTHLLLLLKFRRESQQPRRRNFLERSGHGTSQEQISERKGVVGSVSSATGSGLDHDPFLLA